MYTVQSIQESGNWHPPLQFTAISVEANIANTWIIEATFLNAGKQNTRFLLWMLWDKIYTKFGMRYYLVKMLWLLWPILTIQFGRVMCYMC